MNCQQLKLTANRGSIATDPAIEEQLQEAVTEILDKINVQMVKKGLYDVQQWANEEKSQATEAAEFGRRKDSIARRVQYHCQVGDRSIILLEPESESEVFGFFTTLLAIYDEEFPFEALDYNTRQGIDIIARNKSTNPIADCEYWYVELKKYLGKNFNHSFENLRWIVCWDFDDDLKHDTEVTSSIEEGKRVLQIERHNDYNEYYLRRVTSGSRKAIADAGTRISIVRLKELMTRLPNVKRVEPY